MKPLGNDAMGDPFSVPTLWSHLARALARLASVVAEPLLFTIYRLNGYYAL